VSPLIADPTRAAAGQGEPALSYVRHQADGPWQTEGDPAALRLRGQADQLDQWVALIEGRAHSLPGFAEALAVQETIETLLAGVAPAA